MKHTVEIEQNQRFTGCVGVHRGDLIATHQLREGPHAGQWCLVVGPNWPGSQRWVPSGIVRNLQPK